MRGLDWGLDWGLRARGNFGSCTLLRCSSGYEFRLVFRNHLALCVPGNGFADCLSRAALRGEAFLARRVKDDARDDDGEHHAHYAGDEINVCSISRQGEVGLRRGCY